MAPCFTPTSVLNAPKMTQVTNNENIRKEGKCWVLGAGRGFPRKLKTPDATQENRKSSQADKNEQLNGGLQEIFIMRLRDKGALLHKQSLLQINWKLLSIEKRTETLSKQFTEEE